MKILSCLLLLLLLGSVTVLGVPSNVSNLSAFPNPSMVGDLVNLSAVIVDDVGVNSSWVSVGGVNYSALFGGEDVYFFVLNSSVVGEGTFAYTFFGNDSEGNVGFGNASFVVNPFVDPPVLSAGSCPEGLEGNLFLFLVFGVSFAFVGLGFLSRVGFIGFFGSVMLLVCSWYVGACFPLFALMIALVSLVLMIYFVLGSFGVRSGAFG